MTASRFVTATVVVLFLLVVWVGMLGIGASVGPPEWVGR